MLLLDTKVANDENYPAKGSERAIVFPEDSDLRIFCRADCHESEERLLT
jgi:hypothetical protein